MGNKKSTQVEPTAVKNEGEGYGNPYKFEPDFTGPIKKRRCTDVLCLGMFLVLFVAWGFVAYQGISKGDINKVSGAETEMINIQWVSTRVLLE